MGLPVDPTLTSLLERTNLDELLAPEKPAPGDGPVDGPSTRPRPRTPSRAPQPPAPRAAAVDYEIRSPIARGCILLMLGGPCVGMGLLLMEKCWSGPVEHPVLSMMGTGVALLMIAAVPYRLLGRRPDTPVATPSPGRSVQARRP